MIYSPEDWKLITKSKEISSETFPCPASSDLCPECPQRPQQIDTPVADGPELTWSVGEVLTLGMGGVNMLSLGLDILRLLGSPAPYSAWLGLSGL